MNRILIAYIHGTISTVIVMCLLWLSLENKISFTNYVISLLVITVFSCYLGSRYLKE